MKKNKSFLAAAMVLAIGGIITKAIGAIYRIPLTNLLGSEGMGLYQLVFPFYTLLLAASSAGIPAAISRLIAEKVRLNNYRAAEKIFRVSIITFSFAGLFLSLVLFFTADAVANLQGNPQAAVFYKIISPSVLFVSQISVLRGYFQGRLSMTPTAISQIVEQIVKIAISLTVAMSFLPDVIKAVSYTVLAITVSEAVALLLLTFIYFAGKRRRMANAVESEYSKKLSSLKAVLMVLSISVPLTIGSIILPLSQIIDSALVVNIIGRYYNGSTVALYGLFSGPVNSLISLPVVVAAGIAAAAVPALSSARVSGDTAKLHERTTFVLKLTFLVAVPCAVGMLVFSNNIISLLYGRLPQQDIVIASNLLKASVLSVVFLPIMQTTVSILVALKRSFITTVNLVIAVAVKILLNILLLKEPSINIYGAAISAQGCYFVASMLNLFFILKLTNLSLNIKGVFVKPLICACITLLFAYGSYQIMTIFLSENISLLIAIALSLPIFILTSIKLQVFSEYEIKYIPIINKIKRA